MTVDDVLDQVYDYVLSGDADRSVAATREGLRLGIDPMTLLYDTMIPALEEVGDLFETGEYFLPEMLTAAKAVHAAMEVLGPLLAEAGGEKIGTFVIGTVAGDIHDIGKNLCSVMLEGAGFEVIDLGINVSSDVFVDAIREHNPNLVGLSAFLTTTLPELAVTLSSFEAAGVRDSVKVMVGGAPVTSGYAMEIGADGYAPDASSAAREAKRLLKEGRGPRQQGPSPKPANSRRVRE